MKLHVGTLFAGLVFLVVGLTFMTEALGWWSLQMVDLRYVGPIVLIAGGLAVTASALTRRQ